MLRVFAGRPAAVRQGGCVRTALHRCFRTGGCTGVVAAQRRQCVQALQVCNLRQEAQLNSCLATGATRCSHDHSAAQGRRNASTYVSSHFRMEPGVITAYLDRKELEYRTTDQHYIVKTCPLCKKPHNDKVDNMWKLYIKCQDGAYFCHRCGAGGSWFDLKKQLGDITVEISPASRITPAAMQAASGVEAGGAVLAASSKALEPSTAASHCRALLDTPGFAAVHKYLNEERGLKDNVLRKYLVGATTHPFRDDDGKWVEKPCIVFPWVSMSRTGDTTQPQLHRLKLRALREKHNQALLPKGGQWGLFGAHLVPADSKFVIVTEGEYDALAVHQATGLAAVSLPNGCRSLPVELLPWFESFETIYLWMDNDMAGQEGAEKMAQKLGVGRCLLVKPTVGVPEGVAPPKDANDALRTGCDLGAMIDAAAPLPHDQIVTFNDLREEVFRELLDPVSVVGTPYRWMPSLQLLLKGHRLGELTILTGSTGSGKTTMLSQMSLDLCSQGVPTLWGSFEIKNVRLLKRMLTQLSNRSLIGASRPQLEAAAEKLSALPMYFMRFFGASDVDKVLDAMEYAVYVHDVEHIVLDNLQFMMGNAGIGKGYERFDAQELALEKFRKFASAKNIHLSLVIHPRKEPDDAPLSLNSVFGSAKATQEADNVLIVQTSKKGKYLDVRKNRFDGTLGKIPFEYNLATQRFIEKARSDLPLPNAAAVADKDPSAVFAIAAAQAAAVEPSRSRIRRSPLPPDGNALEFEHLYHELIANVDDEAVRAANATLSSRPGDVVRTPIVAAIKPAAPVPAVQVDESQHHGEWMPAMLGMWPAAGGASEAPASSSSNSAATSRPITSTKSAVAGRKKSSTSSTKATSTAAPLSTASPADAHATAYAAALSSPNFEAVDIDDSVNLAELVDPELPEDATAQKKGDAAPVSGHPVEESSWPEDAILIK